MAVESATAWLARAREVVDELEHLAPDECFATPEVLGIFDGYLAAWEACARDAGLGGVFLWEAEVAAEEAEYHLHAFQKVADLLAARRERTGVNRAPDEGEAFYLALLRGVLAALGAEGPSHAAFAQHLSEFWPGRQPIS